MVVLGFSLLIFLHSTCSTFHNDDTNLVLHCPGVYYTMHVWGVVLALSLRRPSTNCLQPYNVLHGLSLVRAHVADSLTGISIYVQVMLLIRYHYHSSARAGEGGSAGCLHQRRPVCC